MKKVFIITIAFVIMLGLTFTNAHANYNMSWNFQKFNNPNARQVANNKAKTQDGLVESQEDALDQFAQSMERRLYSSVQSQIIDAIEEGNIGDVKNFQAGDLDISVTEANEEVFIEITDTITGESTIVTYSNNWGNSSN
ncbi:curli production assembly/transport component CsgF [Halanaerobium saccharolyticum]|uniref:Curli production assembly/transport component CsgF n=1 Tax=Halanaerobium saccharolyticum TaxID=43595 RepID=A0A4R6LKL5_9FIRM|nr:curli assembly protein CsgF [Halanaerobium saccharolyticum]TDO85238.1 curli production assembly/transport component CsgF [Halanaerobium saccharolyticum]